MRVADAAGIGRRAGAMIKGSHYVVHHGEDRDNQAVIPSSLHAAMRICATRIVRICPMVGYP